MKVPLEHLTAIFINLISSLIWLILTTIVGIIPIVYFRSNILQGIIISCLLVVILLVVHFKLHNKLYYIKWAFTIENATYTLKLRNNGTAIYTQSYEAHIASKGSNELLGSYDWSDAEKITEAKIKSNYAKWEMQYKSKASSAFNTVKNDKGTKLIPVTDKAVDYIIKYDNLSLKKSDGVQNDVEVHFDYDKAKLERTFYAGIKQPIRNLRIKLYTPDGLVTNVKFYAKTFLGRHYNIVPEIFLDEKKDGADKYYEKVVKHPKLFCKYIISWDWVQ